MSKISKNVENNAIKDDFKDFIEILNKHKVDYCITGAYAVSFYSEPRSTRDIDFYIAHTKDNSKRIANAIKEFTNESVDENYFNTAETVILRIGIEPNQIEMANELTGLKDTDIIKHRIKGKYGNIIAYYIGLDDLIKNKLIVKNMSIRGRKKSSDSADYEALKLVRNKLKNK
ncbi:MAG: hypothetical protein A2474_07810 [Elusimicrobia bacterium RIFOXYC2_FULL_34_12]|nr:MAG: hypothetical protein A2474_07810 [Elusimicrobia bacterium RIFOXYC2_FULL_34_12]OGS39138.1 MAG: hypothetical protein A2551_02300 [Elusimicrobia bacterium RIFOXYD2_FULL_34_30]